jgi:DDE superfamily endonuclease/Helix-turn-helix of DDE superfamily endonuclease
MILQYRHLHQHPAVFRALTGLSVAGFDALAAEALPRYRTAEQARLSRPERRRAIGGGRRYELPLRDHLLLAVVWLRRYPTNLVLGYLFGVSEYVALRAVRRVVPLLEAAGLDTMRLPDPGRGRRRDLDALLADTPELAVLIDTFEQRVQRPKERAEADTYYSGKKRQHTLKSQVAVDERDGRIVDVAPSVRGPTADITLLKGSGLLDRLPEGVGGLGDLAYVGMAALHPRGLGATPRRKPRGQPRPAEDIAYNTAFARRRVVAEHSIGRLRRYEALAQADRHHRRGHTMRVRAVAGLVNRQLPPHGRA